MPRMIAISSRVLPLAMYLSISASRAERIVLGCTYASSAKQSGSATTRRIAAESAPRFELFGRYPAAPSARASSTSALSGIPASRITRTVGKSFLSRASSSRPVIPPGMCTSVTTTSGAPFFAQCANASSAEATEPWIEKSPSLARSTSSPSRTIGWSSTISTFIMISLRMAIARRQAFPRRSRLQSESSRPASRYAPSCCAGRDVRHPPRRRPDQTRSRCRGP